MGWLLSSPGGLIAAGVLFGLIFGSFLNVVIHRLPRMMEREWAVQCAELRGEPVGDIKPFSLVQPRSRCPRCGHAIGAWENIPILSYLWLRGRCRSCGTHISWRYPLVETVTGLAFGFAAWHFGPTLAAAGAMLFIAAMIALAFIDFDTQLLPDDITLPLVWIGLLVNIFGVYADLASAVIGAVAGYLSLWSVYWLFKLVTGKEGMGYGDFKLLAAIGAWLGWQLLPLAILFSSIIGLVFSAILMVSAGRSRHTPMPFGPYLAIAGLIALFWGQGLTQAYLGIL